MVDKSLVPTLEDIHLFFKRWISVLEEGDVAAEKAPLGPQSMKENRDPQILWGTLFAVHDAHVLSV